MKLVFYPYSMKETFKNKNKEKFQNSSKTLVLYCFHQYNERVEYFINNVIFKDNNVDFYIICNDMSLKLSDLPVKIPNYVKTLNRENIGYDFGAWSDALLTNNYYKNYDNFIMCNSSIIGPFLPPNYTKKWTDIYLDGLSSSIKLFGSTINTCGWGSCDINSTPHVQSYIFCVNKETLEYLIKTKIFSMDEYSQTFKDCIIFKEVGMSRKIIDNGWNIGSLLKYYKDVDFRFIDKKPTDYNIDFLDDVMYKKFYDKKLWTISEIVFPKGNRDIPINDMILEYISSNKKGLELGGPSGTGITIYKNASIMDNVIFSTKTMWSKHETSEYKYYENKIGKVIISDATKIDIPSKSYDFIFASHILEHIANPLKALKNWINIIKDNGYIVLILPEKSQTFDHKRSISLFSTLLKQYNNNVGEDDMSTLPEILENHDLSRDLPAGDIDQFKKRSMDNFNNRGLHHYVYNEALLKEICIYLKCKYIYSYVEGINIWFMMQKQI